jgi:hypothetical protein
MDITEFWTQIGADLDGEAAGDLFGDSIALSSDGTVVAVGGYANGGGGHARVYQWSGSSWVQLGADLDGEAAGDHFGWSIALSSDGTVVAVGGRYNDGNGANAGHARVYQWSGSSWVQLGADLDGEAAGDEYGRSIALSSDGTVVAVGGRYNDGNGDNAGHTLVNSGTVCGLKYPRCSISACTCICAFTPYSLPLTPYSLPLTLTPYTSLLTPHSPRSLLYTPYSSLLTNHLTLDSPLLNPHSSSCTPYS